MYRWVEHTAELELAIQAGDQRAVFADALAALAELLGGAHAAGVAAERRTVSVTAADRPALLAAWLEELVYLAERDGFIAGALTEIELGPDSLNAEVAGHLGSPPPLVKAVTYHRLTFAPADTGYAASVVLDV